MKVTISQRPIRVSLPAGNVQLTRILEGIEAIVSRAVRYGITDPEKTKLFTSVSREIDIAGDYYRDGLTRTSGADGLPGWTFSRASAATTKPDGGTIQAFAADVPRITNRGLLMERGATQGLSYSSEFDSWDKNNVTISAANPDYAGAPAKNIIVTDPGGASIGATASGIASASPGTTAWCIVRKGTGPTVGNEFALINTTTGNTALSIFEMNYDNGAVSASVGDPADIEVTPLGGPWWLVAITPSTGVSNGDSLRMFCGFIGNVQSAGDGFIMSHAQIENSPFPTSRIVNNSGAAFERVGDLARMTFDAPGDFSLAFTVFLGAHETQEVMLSLDDGSTANQLTVSRLANGSVRLLSSRNGSSLSADLPVKKSGARDVRVALSSTSGSTTISIDGSDPVAVDQARPIGLNRLWFGRSAAGLHLNGHVESLAIIQSAQTASELRAMTAPAGLAPLSDAPLTGHPLQGRFNPATASTPAGTFGRLPVTVYGSLPCALLISEMKGPSALAISRDGTQLFRDPIHRGRWIDVDPLTGLCLAGDETYRTIRWLNHSSLVEHVWSIPSGIPGEIYGLRTNGLKLVVNMIDGGNGATWIWDLDANGVPTGSGTAFAAFTGTAKIARSMLIVGGTLWIAATEDPVNPQGATGALEAYDLGTGALIRSEYSHYANDVDLSPSGEIIGVDEHLNRLRGVTPGGGVRSIMAGLQSCFDYEPSVSSISANVLSRQVTGSIIEASAVEYRGVNGLYAPNGVAVISEGRYAIADTDNGRVIIARETDTWELVVEAVIAQLNEPTKVRVIPGA